MYNLNSTNYNQYMYQIYDEYLDRYYINAIQYSFSAGLVIKYYSIQVNESYNFDDETSIQTSFRNFKFDIYNFTPIIEMDPAVQQVLFDSTLQGTSYSTSISFTLIGISNPLPGDLFHFYDLTQRKRIDKTEIFRVSNVQYIRSFNINNNTNSIKIYKIDAELAPLKSSSLKTIEENNILNTYFWDTDTSVFIKDNVYDYFIYLQDNKSNLFQKNKDLYNYTGSYGYLKLNTLYNFYQKKFTGASPICSGPYISTEIGKILAFFDFYYENNNSEPCEINLVQDDFNILKQENYNIEAIDYLDSLKNILNNLEINKSYSFVDFLDISTDKSDPIKIIEIFKRSKDKEIYYEVIINEDLFKYYDNIYKIFYAYRMYSKDFYSKSIIKIELNASNISTDKALFYNVNGDVTGPLHDTEVFYDPGYVISYQGGPKYFNTNDGILGG